MKTATRAILLALVLTMAASGPAQAALMVFQQYNGKVGYSSDGFGSVTNAGLISANVPAGATVLGAFLYQAVFFDTANYGGTLNGVPVVYGPPSVNNFLASARADVTAIVKPIIDVGPGGVYNFAVTEAGPNNKSGEALVVVYEHPALPESTVGILDGFSAFGGDTTMINFADPLDPMAPGFFAEMILGINHSCCGQRSNVTVNGTLITENAGNFDDGLQLDNSALITVGGYDDPFSPFLPSYANDHERYNLVPRIMFGDTTIVVHTNNPSSDDNIFLATFHVFGRARVNEPPVPEPVSLLLFGTAAGGFALRRRLRRK